MPIFIFTNMLGLWFLSGIAAASIGAVHPLPPLFEVATLSVLGIILFYRTRLPWLKICIGILLAFNLGLFFTMSWRLHFYTTYTYDRSIRFKAVIVEPPDIRDDATFLVVMPENAFGRTLQGKQNRTPIRVHASRYPLFHYGDEVLIEGTLKAPKPFDDFNYPLYLERFHIFAEIIRPHKIVILAHNKGSPLLSWLYRLRTETTDYIANTLPEPESSFLAGIILGEKRSIPADIQDALRNTGTVHIIVMSGSNITLLLDLLLYFLPLYRKKHQLIAVLVIATFISFLSGLSASVLRGACVACLSRYIKSQSRFPWPTPFLIWSAIILLIGNPLLLVADPGFQVSFAAFTGLVYWSEPLKGWLSTFSLFRRLPSLILDSTSQTLAVTIGIGALSFKMFHQLSLIGFIANPFVLWIMEPITFLGLIFIFTSWVPGLLFILKLPLWLLLHITLTVISWLGRTSIGIIHWQANWLIVIGAYLVTICMYLFTHRKSRILLTEFG